MMENVVRNKQMGVGGLGLLLVIGVLVIAFSNRSFLT